jgi:opacity protein-like surface antigen
MKHFAFAVLSCVIGLTTARSQGLLSIGANRDFEEKVPFSVTVASSVGYDSNMNSSAEEHESGYWQNGVSLYFPTGDKRNHLNLGLHYSNIWYFDPAPGSDEFYNNGRVTLDFVRQISPRLLIADSLYVAYETEPDYLIGASVNRRTNQYLYGYNNFSVTYAWTQRFSTVTGHTITGIWYEDDILEGSNNLTNIFHNQFRYSLSRTTTVTLDYRYSITEYEDNPDADSQSHFILLGVDHSFSPQLAGSLRGGVQLRSYDGPLDDRDVPYVEGALNYRVGKNTTLRWYHWLGLEDQDLAGFQSGFSYRTGLTVEQRLTDRLTGSLSAHYIWQEYSESPVGLPDQTDNTFAGSVGLDYRIWRNIGLNASYWYTNVDSDSPFREYERHRVSVGITATF